MKVSELIAKLKPIADVAPDTKVLLPGCSPGLYEELEDVGCNKIHVSEIGGSGPHEIDPDGNEDVVVIH